MRIAPERAPSKYKKKPKLNETISTISKTTNQESSSLTNLETSNAQTLNSKVTSLDVKPNLEAPRNGKKNSFEEATNRSEGKEELVNNQSIEPQTQSPDEQYSPLPKSYAQSPQPMSPEQDRVSEESYNDNASPFSDDSKSKVRGLPGACDKHKREHMRCPLDCPRRKIKPALSAENTPVLPGSCPRHKKEHGRCPANCPGRRLNVPEEPVSE